MDLKVLKIIADQREEGNRLPLIHIVTCGLYTFHNSLQNGLVSSGRKIECILKWFMKRVQKTMFTYYLTAKHDGAKMSKLLNVQLRFGAITGSLLDN